jgi:hypothetical protein
MVFFFVPGGILVREKPEFSDARSLLRSGPAGSLRTDIRAVSLYQTIDPQRVEQDGLKFEELHSTSGSTAVVCMDF